MSVCVCECVCVCVCVALLIQHAMLMRRIIMWPVRFYIVFPHYLIKGTIFEKKKLVEHKICFVFFLQLLSETVLILRRNERNVIKKIIWNETN